MFKLYSVSDLQLVFKLRMFLWIKVSPILFLKYYSCLHSDMSSYVKEKVVQGLHTGVY